MCEMEEKLFEKMITLRPKKCDICNSDIARTKRKKWRKGQYYCPNGCERWYGKGTKKKVLMTRLESKNYDRRKGKANKRWNKREDRLEQVSL